MMDPIYQLDPIYQVVEVVDGEMVAEIITQPDWARGNWILSSHSKRRRVYADKGQAKRYRNRLLKEGRSAKIIAYAPLGEVE